MYNELSEDYDRFVNWQNRLAIELPFIIKHLQQLHTHAILDTATGTGMHAIALAQRGFKAAGADISPGMVERARRNAASAGVEMRFEVAPFGTLAETFGSHSFQAVLCLGNSLPHILSQPDLDAALRDFAACLEPGGMLLVQNRNFDAVMSQHQRWMEPQSHSEGDTEWIFQRFYDFDPDQLLTFNMVTLKRVEHGVWSQKVTSSRIRPLLQDEIVSSMSLVGFSDIQSYGNMSGDPFDPPTSSDLVILAINKS
jgi:glycine/sarcosine N-methyltransferase